MIRAALSSAIISCPRSRRRLAEAVPTYVRSAATFWGNEADGWHEASSRVRANSNPRPRGNGGWSDFISGNGSRIVFSGIWWNEATLKVLGGPSILWSYEAADRAGKRIDVHKRNGRYAIAVSDDPENHWLHVLHRQKSGRDMFLIANQNHQGVAAREFTFRATAPGEPELWDPMRNEITAFPFKRIDNATVQFSLSLEPLETVLLVFQPAKITRPMRIESDTKPIREPIALVRYCSRPWEQPMPDLKRHPLTLSPVKAADPFRSRVTLPADVDLTKCRVYLQMDDLPDNSAAVTVNGVKAGGLIGRPTRLNIMAHLKPGENTILIEPLAPKAARLIFYSM